MSATPARRIALALFGVGISAALLRPQVSDALVVRGDEFLYRAQSARALSYYARALAIDPDNGAAADRFAFVALTSRDRRAIAQSLREATAYLARHPGDAIVLMDRAMAYRAAGNARAALADFALAGARAGDPRAFTFAGFVARRLGEAGLAAQYWRAALELRPGFVPALRALARAR